MENAWQRKKLLPNGDEYEYQKIKKKAYNRFYLINFEERAIEYILSRLRSIKE